MLKKIVVIASMLIIVGFSFMLLQKSQPVSTTSEENPLPEKVEEVLPDTIYSLKESELDNKCSEENEQLCAVEYAIKCTIKPDMDVCKKIELPSFIFMNDPSIDRPTEINYRFIEKKVLLNNTTEIYTESTCNGAWFGLCQGTVIYVLTPSKNEFKWQVKDIYAIE